jgi:hypothetical protein
MLKQGQNMTTGARQSINQITSSTPKQKDSKAATFQFCIADFCPSSSLQQARHLRREDVCNNLLELSKCIGLAPSWSTMMHLLTAPL